MEDIIRLIIMLVIYPLLIIIFHRGKYPSSLVSPKSRRRECGEAIIVFGVYLIIYWSRNPVADLVSHFLAVSFEPALAWTVSNLVLLGTSLCLLLIIEKFVRRRGLSTVGFKLPINKKLLLIFTGLVATYLMGAIIGVISGLHIQAYTFISAVILVPLAEETVFRSLIQTRLEAGLGSVKAWILSGLMFGAYHYYAWFIIGTVTQFSLAQLIWTAVFGMLAGVIFAKTRSLLPPYLLHAANNFVASLA